MENCGFKLYSTETKTVDRRERKKKKTSETPHTTYFFRVRMNDLAFKHNYICDASPLLSQPPPGPSLVMKVSTAEARVLRNRCRNAGGLPRTSGSSHSHIRMGPHPIPNQSMQGQAKTTTNLIITIITQ